MAPFVETEWGGEAYEIIRKIKLAVDPKRLLNPGVIVNDDKDAHIKFLKGLPTVEEEVDRCIECGYCEPKCPSKDLTTSPRRRIVIRRVLKNLEQHADKTNYNTLLEQYQYDGIETCAVDGLCATACPVDINTGDLIKRLRKENHSAAANKTALRVAKNFGKVQSIVRLALQTGSGINSVFGNKAMSGITKGLKAIISGSPLWTSRLSSPPDLSILKNSQTNGAAVAIVYFPSCISRVLGTYPGKKKNIMETFLSVCAKAGVGVSVIQNVNQTCCSQIFSSKGFKDAYQFTANRTIENLWNSSNHGQNPVVIDVSSCAYTLHQLRPLLTEKNQTKFDRLRILDSVDFLHDMVLPLVKVESKTKSIVLHPVCSLQKMKTEDKFVIIAKTFASEVTVPKHSGCCGMAGDRGFLFPELTTSATAPEGNEVKQKKYDGYYSTTKTCEMAMSEAVNENYESILYLVDEGF
jgi:D-lactate dehydrogenase